MESSRSQRSHERDQRLPFWRGGTGEDCPARTELHVQACQAGGHLRHGDAASLQARRPREDYSPYRSRATPQSCGRDGHQRLWHVVDRHDQPSHR